MMLNSCGAVSDSKLSKETALNCDLLEKRVKIFSSDGGDWTQAKTGIKTLAGAVRTVQQTVILVRIVEKDIHQRKAATMPLCDN